jgi:multimeric flavodoxin WrbA
VVGWVLDGMGKGVKAERVRLCELNIQGCVECFTCAKTKKGPGCAQEDDMVELYDRMVDADLVIWASPVFCWGVTGQTKLALDRCLALLTGEDLLKGSRWAVVLSAGGDWFDGADLIVEMFGRMARYAGVEYLGQHVAANCPDLPGLKKNRALAQAAREFGRKLAKQL